MWLFENVEFMVRLGQHTDGWRKYTSLGDLHTRFTDIIRSRLEDW
jgi:hypothetical protein